MEPETDPRAEFRDSNPYVKESARPGPDSPRGKLPVPHRQVWAALQDGLRNLPRVRETVIWCGESWKWAWQYSIGDNQLAFLLPSDRGVSAVLVVEDRYIDELLTHDDMTSSIKGLIDVSEPKAACRRCWTPVLDVETARDFLLSARALLGIVRGNTK
jgi:hypothetical protein